MQLQAHGPVPLTAEAVPVPQRPVVGALVKSAPFEEPHKPLVSSGAEHCAVVPPLPPAQLQLHGPLPVTPDAVPAEHNPPIGALLAPIEFADPQAPLTIAAGGAAEAALR